MIRTSLVALTLGCSVHAFAACPSITWTKQHEHPADLSTDQVRIMDFDADGKLDLVTLEVAPPSGLTGSLFSRRGKGDGTFDAPVRITASDQYRPRHR
jgi:hypothetical protein